MKISSKLMGGLAAIVLTGIITAVVTYTSVQSERALLADTQARFKSVSEQVFALSLIGKDIQLNVAQVQQYLQDIAATRGLDGLDDGPKLAKEQAEAFAANVAKADAIAKELKLPGVRQQLADARATFGPFYEKGLKMSEAYVEAGPKAGNAMMESFDESADKIQASIEGLQKQTAAASAETVSAVEKEIQEVIHRADNLSTITLVAALVLLVVCASTAFMIRASVLRPLGGMTDAMLSLAGGNLQTDIPARGTGDEIGEMAEAVVVFKSELIKAEAARKAEAENDRRQAEMRRQATLEMAETFERRVGEMVRSVAAAATELQSTAEHMTGISDQVMNLAAGAATATEQTTGNASTVAAATEELSASFGDINSRTNQSIGAVGEAVAQSELAVAEVKRLDESARKIGEVVNLINDIAEQTSLLALNATIEAARAGEAGKGFAVVAAEVKALASQTAKATGEVDTQVRAIQAAVGKSAVAMSSVNGSIAKVREIAGTIAAAVDSQTLATTEIARSVGEASRGTGQIQQNVDGVQSAATEAGAAARQVLGAARELSHNGERLREQVDGFLREIRAA